MNIIYGLHCGCHDEGVRYVGQTSRGVSTRFNEHRAAAGRGEDYRVYRWMRKHDVGNIRMSVLEVVATRSELDAAEARWIAELRENGARLTNCGPGGNAPRRGVRASRKTRARMSASQARRYRNPAARQATSGASSARWANPDHRSRAKFILPDDTVRQIRTRVAAGERQKTLATELGISRASVSLIVNRKTYGWVLS